jgi:cyclophilin family peptidyl-prolyl cis-trans isomerase
MAATEKQKIILERYREKAPETVDELLEYVDTAAAVNVNHWGELYWLIGLVVRLLKPKKEK